MFDLEYKPESGGFLPYAVAKAAREEAMRELNERISNIPAFNVETVDKLPEEGDPGTVYVVNGNEYLCIDGKWESLDPDTGGKKTR